MKQSSFLLIALLLISGFAIGQTDRLLTGKVIVDSIAVENVNIINATTEKSTTTNKSGVFSIPVNIGDVLKISAVNLDPLTKIITDADIKMEFMLIKMVPKVTRLKEVTVNENSNINAESLRIVPRGQKHYTPAERKLYTAQSGILDPLLNRISGRTTMLKKEAAVERNERLLLKLDGLYEEEYYTDVLKIPSEHIRGFQYFLIEDPDFVRALQAKNKTMTMFLVKRLAFNYNTFLKPDKK